MAIRVALNHVTHYKYDRPVMMAPHIVRLRPAPHARTPIPSYSLSILPQKHFLNWQQDPYSNYLARLVFPEPATELKVEVDLIAEMTVVNPFDFFVETSAEVYPFTYEPLVRKELAPYLETEKPGPLLASLIETSRRKDVRTIDYIVELNWTVHQALKYLIRMEPGVQAAERTLEVGCGSCRDFAWLLVNLLRHLGLAARFVSGYLIQLTADVKSLDGPSGPEKDFTDLHAWAEVYLPGAGWVGLDATSGLLTGEGHIPLACTAEPLSAAPVSGTVGECEVEFAVSMSVKRVHEDPRVTKPYTREQWAQIESLGHGVDDRLRKGDVRLTMGGEPTFVSIDDMDGAEWSTEAMGPNKRRLAGQLIKRLRDRFVGGGGAFMHFGQGKWYPGESLPRWSLSCYWRKDGIPMWNDHSLIVEDDRDLGHTDATAQRFITELAVRLGGKVHAEHAMPAYEDVWHHLLQERKLPVNVDPLKSNLKNAEDRKRLAKIFENGLDKVVGYVLPLIMAGGGERGKTRAWQSGVWFFRAERMHLIPGDSAMGFRLPLDSVPWVAPEDYPVMHERDPLELLPALPDPRRRHLQFARAAEAVLPSGYREQEMPHPPMGGGIMGNGKGRIDVSEFHAVALPAPPTVVPEPPKPGESAPWVLRTALCVEPRNGVLHIFMPPVRDAEDYLDLIARIEETAAELKTPVIIEGYTPPQDSRIHVLKATPDPGVIEVNTHPVRNWDEAVTVTAGLYEDAHYSRLGTEKFMLDGRHTGTGGGNHIVMGGPTPNDSPFLRRPDLLKSLVAYWHNHPSLSYLFSGMFVGPTSQAPRVDEGRADNVYELEIAMRQIPDRIKSAGGAAPAPWLVDRIFRNLLVDLTGNTHRAEFCIDKLYSPDSSTGRLGLLEFRGFEMPPHAEMSLTQQLLLRALVARFWEQPYRGRVGVEGTLVRWGTQLHDRFLLPHFVANDFQEVLGEMEQAGFPLKPEWFAPHFEFRFPVLGTLELPVAGGIQMELRQAIEPWNVLGEEPAGGGTARFVDSSLERIQIKLNGLIDSRHVATVNGIAIPLHSTGRNGEYVAGVRYRAWQPPSCLHPTIPVHTPLIFDIVDTWNNRAVGGCAYHVVHPGGRSFETLPVNAFEAESRRASRFFKFGHTPGERNVKVPRQSLEFPLTLDLRRQ